jgi:hypothetical protein
LVGFARTSGVGPSVERRHLGPRKSAFEGDRRASRFTDPRSSRVRLARRFVGSQRGIRWPDDIGCSESKKRSRRRDPTSKDARMAAFLWDFSGDA